MKNQRLQEKELLRDHLTGTSDGLLVLIRSDPVTKLKFWDIFVVLSALIGDPHADDFLTLESFTQQRRV